MTRMAIFLEDPIYKDVPGGRSRQLINTVDVFGLDWATTIPAGFIYDGASVPRILWSLYPPFGSYNRASLLHDWFYRSGECTRAQADWRFLEAMVFDEVPKRKRWPMYIGCRIGAWVSWNKYRRAEKKGAKP